MRNFLERNQVWLYFASVMSAAVLVWAVRGTEDLEPLINPFLALMLFATFLQVPLRGIGAAFREVLFLAALLLANFLVVPVFVFLLLQFAPADPLLKLGVLMVLLTPCIDYVITFAQLGRGDSARLLASTPLLLGVQMVLLPVYLTAFLGRDAAELVSIGPFVHAFVWLVLAPLALAALVQFWASRSSIGSKVAEVSGLMPVPLTAMVLFVVVAAMVPLLDSAADRALATLPLYIVFAIVAPVLGWLTTRAFRLGAMASSRLLKKASQRSLEHDSLI